MRKITVKLEFEDPTPTHRTILTALEHGARNQGKMALNESIPPGAAIDYDKRGLQANGMYLLYATLTIPEATDTIAEVAEAVGLDRLPMVVGPAVGTRNLF